MLLLAGAGALWLIPRLPWAIVAAFLLLVGVTWSFFQLSGVALASRLAKPENRGLALGTYNAISGVSTMIAGVSSGYLAQHAGYHITYIVAASLLLIAVLILWRLPDPLSNGNTKAVTALPEQPSDSGLTGGRQEGPRYEHP